ncbi:alpha/beta hydrolase-fold protein [Streptomyces sp. NPDC002928]|uniref:alpha/beta hydrolase n=1 Tax=Streptomyces sp. NPDC002928 TaxID=3154440 RepID=UPI0033A83BE4
MPTLFDVKVQGHIPKGFAPFVCGNVPELGCGQPRNAPTLIPIGSGGWGLRVQLSGDFNPTAATHRLRIGIRSLSSEDFRLGARLLPAPQGLRLDVRAEARAARPVALHYYTSWRRVHVRVRHPGGETVLPMTKDGSGLTPDELRWVAEIPGELCAGDWGFVLEGPAGERDGQATASPGGGYRPRGTTVHLRAGEIFSTPPPRQRRDPRVVSLTVPSPELAHEFLVHLVLPRDFGVRNTTYGVVFLNDGQNQISGRGQYGGWHIDATVASLTRYGRMRESILAAVEMHPNRNRAYLAPGDRNADPGQADVYTNFLADRVLPLLKDHYRADSSGGTTIIGASNGAIHGLYAALHRPESFTRVGCLSYALLQPEVNRARLAHPDTPLPERVYLDSGTRWAPEDRAQDSDDNSLVTHALRDDLLTRGLVLERDIRHVLAYGDPHNETAWRRRVTGCLEFLLPPD